jgi:hypothetical protein
MAWRHVRLEGSHPLCPGDFLPCVVPPAESYTFGEVPFFSQLKVLLYVDD